MPAHATKAARTQLDGAPPPHRSTSEKVQDFWDRITEGLELAQLWSQFKEEAKTSYRLYSREVPVRGAAQTTGQARWTDVARGFFWAVFNKLSPAKRVLLLISLVLLFIPGVNVEGENFTVTSGALHVWGGIGILVLLLLEVADRVTMKRDLEIAREIQLWLVPEKAPDIPGLEIAFFNRPANTVAGDYYDVFQREPGSGGAGKYLIAVADVAGKSLPAALLMATFQASLKTQSASSCGLVSLVSCVNQYACAHSRGGQRFTTAFIAEFDPASRGLAYVNAGHNAPLLLKTTGELVRLDVGGVPLGIMPGAPYGDGSVTLAPGDVLLIFTDGLVEAVNERDEEYEEERVIAQLRVAAANNPTQMLDVLRGDLQNFIGMARQHDDITCVLLRCTG